MLEAPSDINILFSNMEVILSVNEMLQAKVSYLLTKRKAISFLMLWMKLEQVYALPLDEQNPGAVFQDLAMAMKVYITYCSNHPAACQRLQDLRKNVPSMNEVLEAQFPS